MLHNILCVAAGDGKQDKAGSLPSAPAAGSAPRGKTDTPRSVEEMIQAKKAAAPTKAGIYRLCCSCRSALL